LILKGFGETPYHTMKLFAIKLNRQRNFALFFHGSMILLILYVRSDILNWNEITIIVSTNEAETAVAIANMTVPYGVYIEDYSDLEQGALEIAHIDLIDEELASRDAEFAPMEQE
jgi:hypothetical protein